MTNGTIIQQISTHKAVVNNDKIDIFLKGFEIGSYKCEDELMYRIPLENKDDVFSIMERYQEDNRINLAQANGEF